MKVYVHVRLNICMSVCTSCICMRLYVRLVYVCAHKAKNHTTIVSDRISSNLNKGLHHGISLRGPPPDKKKSVIRHKPW